MDNMKYIATAFSVILMVGMSSCVNGPLRPVNNSKDTIETENIPDSEMVIVSKDINEKKPITKESLKESVEDFFTHNFGRFAKVKKWTKCDIATTGNCFVSGVVSAPVRGDKSNYSFDAILNSSGTIRSMQLNHVGKSDCYYNWVDGQRLDDNKYSSRASLGNIRLTAIGLRAAGIRYVTSRKMTKEQIMKFITQKTDMKLKNYYFQISESNPEYAAYCGDQSQGVLFMYDSNKIYDITIYSDGSVSYK